MKPKLHKSSLPDKPKRPAAPGKGVEAGRASMLAAEALRESEERYRQIVETANEGVWTLDADCRTAYANPRLAAMLGCTVEELLGRPTEDFMFPEDVPPHLERIARRRNGESGTYELRLRRKDGGECWTLVSASPVLDAQGRYAGSFAMLSDITEHKRAEEALRESEERHRLLFETMGQGVVYQDADGRITSANPAAERILGLALDQMQCRTSADPRWRAVHEDGSDFPGETHASMVALRTGREVHGVIMGVFNPKLEDYRWMSIDAVPQFRPGEDKPYQVYTTFTDITGLRAAGEAARLAGARAQEYLDIASVMLVAMDTAGTVTLINRRGCEVLGWSEREAVGKDWFETFLPARTQSGMRSVFCRLLAGESVGPEYTECLVLTRSGDERVIAWHDQLLHDETGRVTGILSSGEDVTERRQAEDALHASEERYRHLIEEMGEGIALADADEQFTFANRAAEELFGVPRGGLVGRGLFEFLDAEQADLVRGQTAHRRAGVRGSYELTITLPDQTKRTALLTATPKHNAAGEYVGAFGIFRDVTARRQAEQQAQAERDQLRRILDAMPDGVYVVGQGCELQYVNPSLLARGGPVNGRKCYDYFHRRTEPCPDCTNEQVFAGGAAQREYTTKQGVTYEIQDVPTKGNDGRPARLVFMRDITERKRAEEREAWHLKDMAFMRDTAMGFVRLGPGEDVYSYIAAQLHRLAGDAYVAVNSHDPATGRFTVRAVAGLDPGLQNVIKLMGREPVGTEFALEPDQLAEYAGDQLMKLDGGPRGLSYGKLPNALATALEKLFGLGDIYASAFYWQGGLLGTMNILMRKGHALRNPDVVEAFVNQTSMALRRKLDADELERHRQHLQELVEERTRELKQTQDRLVTQARLATLGRVAGSVAHEIRNPLGAILNASYFLQKTAANKLEGKSLRHLRIIDESIGQANRAITAVLDYTWRLQGEPKKCAPRPLLERAVAEATIPAAVKVHLGVKPGLPHVLVDDRQMVAVFRNLFTNAAQAMPGDGTLRVAARGRDETVVVEIADTGCGIKPEHLGRVFEPLFTTSDIGLGLGLAICKEFVAANNGTISVESEVGKGTTFTVVLPIAAGEIPSTKARP